MAVGFTPKHVEDFAFDGLTPNRFLALAFETATKLGWTVSYISNAGIIAYQKDGIVSSVAEIKIKIEAKNQEKIATLSSSYNDGEMVDFGANKKNIDSFIAAFDIIKTEISTEHLDAIFEGLQPHFTPDEEDVLILPEQSTSEKIRSFLSLFIPTKEFFVTPVLIDLNILIFVIMAICGVGIMSPDSKSLIDWGANFTPMTLNGQWWRLLTCCFLHIGIFHLLLNMYALLYIGVLLEYFLGKTRFLAAYLLTGIAASLLSLWWHDITLSAGASGAIFGMYGVFIALLTTDLIEKSARQELLTSMAVFVGYNLLYGLQGGIDNAAHIGGLLSGLAMGYAFVPSLRQYDNQKIKYSTILFSAFLVLAITAFLYQKIPNDLPAYDKKIEQFFAYQAKAIEVYNQPEKPPRQEWLRQIKEITIVNWNECLKTIDEADKLNLPNNIHERNKNLKKYCELQIKNSELTYKALEESSDAYSPKIDICKKQLDSIMTVLNGDKS